MGGGVGKFLSETCIYEKKSRSNFNHRILLLDKPEKTTFTDRCLKWKIPFKISNDLVFIEKEIKNADVVILHWWHNPIMCKLLNDFPKIKIRLIIWSHVSGCNYPAIPEQFALLPHKMFFTTPYSYENPFWNEKSREKILKCSKVIYGLGVSAKSDNHISIKKDSDCYNIGYVGTLNKSKINENFIEYCKAILELKNNVKFYLVGDLNNEELLHQIEANNFESKFELVGYTNDVNKYYEIFDIFAYPLNPYHFGTTENVILEAMSYGLPVVVLNQNTEKYILTDMEDGVLANSIDDYAKKIVFLLDNPDKRSLIGENAKISIQRKFSIKNNICNLKNELNDILTLDKKTFEFKSVFGDKPYEWFLTCLGEDKKKFEDSLRNDNYAAKLSLSDIKPILKGKGKSSIEHFYNTFPNDKKLELLHKLIADKTTRLEDM